MSANAARTAPDSRECTNCGGTMSPVFATRDHNQRASNAEFRYSRCGRCGLISLMNAPGDLAPYYTAEYHTLPRDADEIERGVEHERYKIELVRRYMPGGRLLEIGPSWGAFCLLAKRAGFAVEAIEMNAACCEYLEGTIGVRAIRGDDEAAAIRRASMPNVIALWHVVEHMRDPWAVLEQAAERLAPGGVIVIATPNPSALQFRALRGRWAHVDAPRHLHLLPPDVLRGRMRALGLREELCTTRDPGSLRWNSFGWSWSLAGLAAAPTVKRGLRLAGRAVAAILAPIEGREGLGSAYTAAYRKPAP